jgi:hypothetical protein
MYALARTLIVSMTQQATMGSYNAACVQGFIIIYIMQVA